MDDPVDFDHEIEELVKTALDAVIAIMMQDNEQHDRARALARVLGAARRAAGRVEHHLAGALPADSGAVKYRDHRGSLFESMGTYRVVASRAALIDHLHKTLLDAPADLAQRLYIEPYARDPRIKGWEDTHIVTIEGLGVVGFTSGPL